MGRTDVGLLAPGMLADLLVVSLESVFVAPVHRVASALVFCASPADITHVVVAGRLLIDDGALTMADEGELLRKANSSARDVFERAGVESRLSRNGRTSKSRDAYGT